MQMILGQVRTFDSLNFFHDKLNIGYVNDRVSAEKYAGMVWEHVPMARLTPVINDAYGALKLLCWIHLCDTGLDYWGRWMTRCRTQEDLLCSMQHSQKTAQRGRARENSKGSSGERLRRRGRGIGRTSKPSVASGCASVWWQECSSSSWLCRGARL